MKINIHNAINLMVKQGLILPHGIMPGHGPGTGDSEFTEESWNKYQWNPPEKFIDKPAFGYSEKDKKASLKPVWNDIISSYQVSECSLSQEKVLRNNDYLTTKAIARLYHPQAPNNPNKEWQVRLSGQDTTEADKQRKEFIEIHNQFKERIKSASTVEELEQIQAEVEKAFSI